MPQPFLNDTADSVKVSTCNTQDEDTVCDKLESQTEDTDVKLNSISNHKLTLLRKLNRKKYRLREQLFFVEGTRAVEQIIENKKLTVQKLFFDENQQYWKQIQWESYSKIIGASTLTAEEFSEVSDTENPQGVMALCQMPRQADLQKLNGRQGLIIATDAIQDPGNLGTIVRTASWFGVKGILLGKGTADLFHPKVVRSTAGATGTLPYANVKLNDILSFFEVEGWQIILLDSAADSIPLPQIEKRNKTIIVVGNEAHGIDPLLLDSGRQKTRIAPPHSSGDVESLNAAIAVAIALYALT